MGRSRKIANPKKCSLKSEGESKDLVEAPHSFVIHRGLPCPHISDLTKDFRRVMEPFTAINLKERKSNKIKDFVSLSGIFHVSHLCIFNKASTQLSFKIARLPRGPTLTFKVHQFTLSRDVIASTKRQFVDEEIFRHPPLTVMNNFTGEGRHLKLLVATFQNMFPPINLTTVNLATVKRCVLFSYNRTAKLIEMRHYSITIVPVGVSRGIKKVALGKIPNLSRCENIEDFIMHGGGVSDSEFEDDEGSHVVLSQHIKRKGTPEGTKSSIRLHEIGPRLTFELVKIEDGLFTGEVLHHETIVKSEAEIKAIKRMREKKKRLKEMRKRIQAKNKEKKENEKSKSEISLGNTSQDRDTTGYNEKADSTELDVKNDAEYYREEVGEEPAEELFKENKKTTRFPKPKRMTGKRRNLETSHPLPKKHRK